MSNVAEFIEIRRSIEALAAKMTTCIKLNEVQDLRQNFDEASRQLELLKSMADNDVQVIAVGRLTRHLAGLGAKVAKTKPKKPPKARKTAAKKTGTAAKKEKKEGPIITVYERS